MDRGKAIFLNNSFRQADGVFEVVTVPGHERDAHVLTQRQFTHIGGRAVSHDVATLYTVTLAHQRTLVDASVLVGTGVFGQVVDVDTGFASFNFIISNANNDTAGINRVDHAATTSHDANAGVTSYVTLHAGTYQRLVSAQGWYSLTLHVGTHQRTVGVIVFQERDQRRCNRNNLLRRNVHQGDVFRRLNGEFVQVTNSYQFVDQHFLVVHRGRSLSDHVISFFDGGQENDLVSYQCVFHYTVRALEEAVLVGARIGSQGVDQTDVRTFRRLNRANTAVVSRVYVTNFKARTLTRQTARAQCRNTALVGDLGQRVVLVHELGQLAGTEELFHRRSHWLGVDQVLRHQAFAFSHRQTLFDRTLNTYQANAELVLGHFAYTANTTVTQVVDVIDDAFTVTDVDQGLQHGNDVFFAQHARTFDLGTTDTTVELHPADRRQVIALRAEEQVVEQSLGSVFGWRLAWTHHAIDFDQRFQLVAGGVDLQRVGDERTAVDIVGVQRFDANNLALGNFCQDFSGQLGVALSNDFASSRMHDSLGRCATQDIVQRHNELFDTGFFQLVDMTSSDTTTLLNNHLAFVIGNVDGRDFTAQTLWNQLQADALTLNVEHVGGVERVQHLLSGITQRAQQYRCRQLATTVNTHEHAVFRVELEVQPRTTVRNDTRGIKQLTGAVRLAAVVVKEHARGTVQLGNNYTLGTVDYEGTVFSHQGDFTHVDFLLFDVLDRFVRRFFVENDQTNFYPQRYGVRYATQHAFFDIKCRFAQAITDVLQRSIAGVADDRENGFEGRMQAHVAELIFSRSRLQEFTIRIQLDCQEIRHIHDVRQLAKVLADTFFLSI